MQALALACVHDLTAEQIDDRNQFQRT
jgi:hypothetical protein